MSKKKTEYRFSKETGGKLKGFKTYLQELGNSKDTIGQKLNYTGYFLTWLEAENLSPEETRYNDLLNFIDHCHLEGKSKRHINSKLRAIRNFYNYLKTQNQDVVNPASNLHLKGIRQKLPSGIIDFKHLESFYHSFKGKDLRSKRNKVILSLLIYQGLTSGELKQLEISHLKLKQGKIHIPGNRRRNSRTLELKPVQVLELHNYLTETRPKVVTRLNKTIRARVADQLFISINGSRNIKNSLFHMFKGIRKTNPEIRNPKQIRASVITYWLKNYNLRQVQYMAGHKYVSSTERYQLNNLDNLQKKIEKYHPLEQNRGHNLRPPIS